MADYIDREVLIEKIEQTYCPKCSTDNYCRACWVDDMRCEIEDAPVADVAPVVRGHWLTWDEKFPGNAVGKNLGVFCSVCGNHSDYSSPYCANCGAKMDEEENDG